MKIVFSAMHFLKIVFSAMHFFAQRQRECKFEVYFRGHMLVLFER